MPAKQIFISYSHKDAKWLDRLQEHLGYLEHIAEIETWADTRLKPGDQWREDIARAIAKADVALLLISAAFLRSPFILNEEIPPLLKAPQDDGALIVPIIVGSSLFTTIPTLSRYEAIPDPSRPLADMSTAERDKVFVAIAERVRTWNGRRRDSAPRNPKTETVLAGDLRPSELGCVFHAIVNTVSTGW